MPRLRTIFRTEEDCRTAYQKAQRGSSRYVWHRRTNGSLRSPDKKWEPLRGSIRIPRKRQFWPETTADARLFTQLTFGKKVRPTHNGSERSVSREAT